MRIEFNIAMMALAAIAANYREGNDKQLMKDSFKLLAIFCAKYDLLNRKDNSGDDIFACESLRSAMSDFIEVNNILE